MELYRPSTVCFTGHRTLRRAYGTAIHNAAENAVRDLIMQGYDTFLVGGAIGFDTMAQQIAVDLREELPYLRVVMAIPCIGQDVRWNEQDQKIYRDLLSLADERIILHDHYTNTCMMERNRYMIDHSSACIALYDGRHRGGTAATIRYAGNKDTQILNIWQGTFSERASV